MFRLPFLLGAAGAALLPAALPAQTLQIPLGNSSIAPQPTPTPFPSPVVPPVTLPSPAPTAAATPPRAATRSPDPVNTKPTRPRPTATPTPAVAPTPDAGAAPGAGPTPATSPLPTLTPMPTPAPFSSATPTPPIETVIVPQVRTRAPIWPWLVGSAAVLLGLAYVLTRRRSKEVEELPEEVVAEPVPVPAPPPTPSAPAAPAMFSRAPARDLGDSRLAIALRPSRAGLNMLTATVDAEVTVTNVGSSAAVDIRADLALFAATRSGEPALAEIAAGPVIRPVVPTFALAPGEQRRFRAIAALPLATIEPLDAGGRPMFVPLVAVHLRWRDESGERGAAQGWAVGVERVDSAKLAPIWLDQPGRTFDTVAARANGAMVEA